MRLLTLGNMYPPHRLGGYELMWSSWVERAESQGHAVRVLTTDFLLANPPDDEADQEGVHRELRWYWRDHGFPRLSPLERLRIERHNRSVLRLHLEEFRPDAVVWWSMAGMSLSLIELVRRAGMPAVAVLADYWLQYAAQIDGWMRMFSTRSATARAVERLTGIPTRIDMGTGMNLVFVSETLRQKAQASLGRLGPSEVMLHGPDSKLFKPFPEHDWAWDLLYVGRIDERKGIDLAILALEHLPAAATLKIVGPGDEEHLTALRDLIAGRGLEGRVSFDVASRDELPAVYAAADVLLFPVRWGEPFGLVPVEAMSVGTPVIATGRGGSGEYLRDGVNCLIFDPCDDDRERGARNLAGRVHELGADGDLRARLRAGGLDTAGELSAERFNDAVLATLERITKRDAELGRDPAG